MCLWRDVSGEYLRGVSPSSRRPACCNTLHSAAKIRLAGLPDPLPNPSPGPQLPGTRSPGNPEKPESRTTNKNETLDEISSVPCFVPEPLRLVSGPSLAGNSPSIGDSGVEFRWFFLGPLHRLRRLQNERSFGRPPIQPFCAVYPRCKTLRINLQSVILCRASTKCNF